MVIPGAEKGGIFRPFCFAPLCPLPDSCFHVRTGRVLEGITTHLAVLVKSATWAGRRLAAGVHLRQSMETALLRETRSPATLKRILIADDQEHVLDALEFLLKGCGFSTVAVSDPARALAALDSERFDAILMDLNYARDTTSGKEGLELVSQIRSRDQVLPIVVMTAWGTVDQAVEAMRRGASDFVQKPWDNHELVHKLQDQLSTAEVQRRTQRQRDDELSEAREIQTNLLPKTLPQVPGYEIAALTQPMRFVGGDYYNVVSIGADEVAFCIADVAGKGLPAALLMSSLQAALSPLIHQHLPPREICHRLNTVFCDLMPVGKFISLFYGVLNTAEKRLAYCNAGHNPPLLIRAGGKSMELNTGGAVLGQFPEWRYEQRELHMESGDRLMVFTDGLVEAGNAQDEPFGEGNVRSIAEQNPNASADDLLRILIDTAARHCGGQFQDDASVLVLRAE
jgi:phosphoserine phosphatase RsbU/P